MALPVIAAHPAAAGARRRRRLADARCSAACRRRSRATGGRAVPARAGQALRVGGCASRAVAAAAHAGLASGRESERSRSRRPRPRRRVRPAAARGRRVQRDRRARPAARRGAQGRPPRQRRRGTAGAARANSAACRRDRGRADNTYGHPTPSTLDALRAVAAGRSAPTATGPCGCACGRPDAPGAGGLKTEPSLTGLRRLARRVARYFRPAYLIHGDDHGRIGERRARLRAMAERESRRRRCRAARGRRLHAGGGRRGAVRDDVRARAGAS